MRVIERFDIYMDNKHLNDNRVTKDLRLTVGVIGKSRKEGRDLSDRVIEKILNFYTDLNRVWLLTGEGEMILKPTISNTNSQVIGSHNTGSTVKVDSSSTEISAMVAMLQEQQRQNAETQRQNANLQSMMERFLTLMENSK